MPDSQRIRSRLTVNGSPVTVPCRRNGCGGRDDCGTSLPNVGEWRSARSAVRNGNLLRVPRVDQWNSALPKLPDPLRTGHGCGNGWITSSQQRFDVLVIGAGPAGMAAAVRAAECGANVGIVDDNPTCGGQIWRGADTRIEQKMPRDGLDRLQIRRRHQVVRDESLSSAGSGRASGGEGRDGLRELRYDESDCWQRERGNDFCRFRDGLCRM